MIIFLLCFGTKLMQLGCIQNHQVNSLGNKNQSIPMKIPGVLGATSHHLLKSPGKNPTAASNSYSPGPQLLSSVLIIRTEDGQPSNQVERMVMIGCEQTDKLFHLIIHGGAHSPNALIFSCEKSNLFNLRSHAIPTRAGSGGPAFFGFEKGSLSQPFFPVKTGSFRAFTIRTPIPSRVDHAPDPSGLSLEISSYEWKESVRRRGCVRV